MTAISAILAAVSSLRNVIAAGAGPLAVLDAIKPLLLEFAFSDAVLGDDQVAAVQDRVHRTLRDAGLLEARDV